MYLSIKKLNQIIIERQDIVKRIVFDIRDILIEENSPLLMTGVRGSGKSYMLYQIMDQLVKKGHSWDEFIYLNFEDERLLGFKQSDFNSIFEAFYSLHDKEPILFLDEIQNIDGWENFARRIADEKRLVYITGSNASLLSKEIEAILGGRYLSKHIYTYSFKEFLKAKNHSWDKTSLYSTREQAKLLKLFFEYMVFGGFPELPKLNNKRDYLSSVYNKIFLGDVIARNQIVNTKALEVLVKKLAESVGQALSYTRLTNIIKSVGISISKTTVIQYIDYLKDSFLIFDIENYSQKIVERTTNPKYYFIDSGLTNLFLLDANPSLLENLVALSLIRKYGRENVYFYQDKNSELDFYVPQNSLAIQSSYSVLNPETKKRELTSIINFNKYEKVEKNIILTFNEEEVIEEEGIEIEVIPMYKWLLNFF
ncbi:MAG: ATP-binding protein [Tissierellales bacterium]